jgi:hypothetical protein
MATTVSQCLTRARRYLGVKAAHPRFTGPALLDEYNTAVGQLHDECARIADDLVAINTTITVDAGVPGRFTLATQAAPITRLTRIVALRDTDETGPKRDEVPFDDLQAYTGLTYALTGFEGNLVIHVPPSDGVQTLWMRYQPELAFVTDESQLVPSWIPDRFVDVPALMVALQAFPYGGEEPQPPELVSRLQERQSMLWQYWSTRGSAIARRRPSSEGQAPYTFI